jgi:hypothetical protein
MRRTQTELKRFWEMTPEEEEEYLRQNQEIDEQDKLAWANTTIEDRIEVTIQEHKEWLKHYRNAVRYAKKDPSFINTTFGSMEGLHKFAAGRIANHEAKITRLRMGFIVY